MKAIAILATVAVAITAAMPASADERGRGSKHNGKPLVDLSATVKGIIDVDADILSKNRKGASILDLDATVGKLGASVDLDVSKRKGVDLDIDLGKRGRNNRNNNHNNYDFGGGVGN